jgi:DNA-binding CsgD family transcriptional regulator
VAPHSAAPSIVLYDEQQLVPNGDPPRDGMPSLVTQLQVARTAAEREALVRRALHAAGFEWLAYGTVLQHSDGTTVPRTFLTTYAHTGWVQRYFGERYHAVDPRHLEAPRSGLPLVWDLGDIDRSEFAQHASGPARRFLDDFFATGIGSGVFVQLPVVSSPNERAVISLLSSTPDRRWITEAVLGRALTLSLCLHEFLSQHVQRQEPGTASPGLSALQQQILSCVRSGQSDKQIAHRLSLSLHAVDYHMRQLRRRFSARNRVQLVNAAM